MSSLSPFCAEISELRRSIATDLRAAIELKVQLLGVDWILFKDDMQRPDRVELEGKLKQIHLICARAMKHYRDIISNSKKLERVVRSMELRPLTREDQAIAKSAKTYAKQLSDSAKMCKPDMKRTDKMAKRQMRQLARDQNSLGTK